MDMILRIALHGEYLRFPSTLEHNVFQNHRHNCGHVNFGEGSLTVTEGHKVFFDCINCESLDSRNKFSKCTHK